MNRFRTTTATLFGASAILFIWGAFVIDGSQAAPAVFPPTIVLFPAVVGHEGALINGVALPANPDKAVTQLSWDWGDGDAEVTWFPGFHRYRAFGKYTVTVTAHQSDGLTASASVPVNFRPLPVQVRVPSLAYDANDLAVTRVEILSTSPNVVYRYQITNLGSTAIDTRAPAAPWVVQSWFSWDSFLGPEDIPAGGHVLLGAGVLVPGASFEGESSAVSAEFGRDPRIKYLIVEVHSNGAVTEGNLGNNHLIVPLPPPSLTAPRIRASWTLPATFSVGGSAAFLVTICNDGGAGVLLTQGSFGALPTGEGVYPIASGQCIGFGFDSTMKVQSGHVHGGQVCIFTSSSIRNSAGEDSYSETRCVPVS